MEVLQKRRGWSYWMVLTESEIFLADGVAVGDDSVFLVHFGLFFEVALRCMEQPVNQPQTDTAALFRNAGEPDPLPLYLNVGSLSSVSHFRKLCFERSGVSFPTRILSVFLCTGRMGQ